MKEQLNSLALADSIEAFYTGGAIQWSSDGITLFTACGNYIKTSNVEDGKQGLLFWLDYLGFGFLVNNFSITFITLLLS